MWDVVGNDIRFRKSKENYRVTEKEEWKIGHKYANDEISKIRFKEILHPTASREDILPVSFLRFHVGTMLITHSMNYHEDHGKSE